MKKNNTRTLELANLQNTLISTCNNLNRPIRKNQLIKMITHLFECNTPKQVEFALLDLVEQDKLHQKNHFIVTPEFSTSWDGSVTAADEGIIKFLLSLKEEAKHDIFFNVYAQEPLTPHSFFKYVEMKYPALLQRQDTALAYMKHMESTLSCGLNNDFYAEMNDYPAENRWLTSFFNNPDCRILIKNMDMHKNHINIMVVLILGKKRSCRKASADLNELKEKLPNYFNKNMVVHIKRSMVAIPFGRGKNK